MKLKFEEISHKAVFRSVAAPTFWNRMPVDIRNTLSLESSKSVLQTHPFEVLSPLNNVYLLNTLFGISLYSAFEWFLIVKVL